MSTSGQDCNSTVSQTLSRVHSTNVNVELELRLAIGSLKHARSARRANRRVSRPLGRMIGAYKVTMGNVFHRLWCDGSQECDASEKSGAQIKLDVIA